MPHRFGDLMFSPTAKAMQEEFGSRAAYARRAGPDPSASDRLAAGEIGFIGARDSFYMASVTPEGWPYVQHRGGAPGFVRVLDDRTLGFSDYPGNKQFVSLGNLATNDRVSLFLMDYPNRRRLKILGHAQRVDLRQEVALAARLADQSRSPPTRALLVRVEAFEWNCPQYITPRYTEAELAEVLAPVRARITALEHDNAMLRGTGPGATLAPTIRQEHA